MHHLPALPRLTERAPDIIIDGRLAFSDYGLLLSLALAKARRVWLVQGLWALLQRFEVIDYPEFSDDSDDVMAMSQVLRQWHQVWSGSTLLERFCWVGDMLFESRLPPDFDRDTSRRMQAFAALLEQLADLEGPVSSLTVCARDAAALAAVNAIDAPVILTTMDQDGGIPICRLLERAGVACTALDARTARSLSRAALGPEPPHVLSLALTHGLRLAAVSLLAPRAIAAGLEDLSDLDPEDLPYSEDRDPWHGATAYFWEVQI